MTVGRFHIRRKTARTADGRSVKGFFIQGFVPAERAVALEALGLPGDARAACRIEVEHFEDRTKEYEELTDSAVMQEGIK